MATAPQVAVLGLRSLMRDLAKASDPRAGAILDRMKAAGATAAAPVAERARSSVPIDENSPHPGQLAGDVRITSSRSGAAVRMGRAGVPYAGPVDFGGYPAGRPFVSTGRYLYPAAEALADPVITLYSAAIQKAFDAYNWTNESGDPQAIHD
jgi:hypothetical protein